VTAKHVVDWKLLADDLDMACRLRGCSLRRAALHVGLAPSGLTRLRQGKALSADSLAALVAWLYSDVPPWITVTPPSPSPERSTQT